MNSNSEISSEEDSIDGDDDEFISNKPLIECSNDSNIENVKSNASFCVNVDRIANNHKKCFVCKRNEGN